MVTAPGVSSVLDQRRRMSHRSADTKLSSHRAQKPSSRPQTTGARKAVLPRACQSQPHGHRDLATPDQNKHRAERLSAPLRSRPFAFHPIVGEIASAISRPAFSPAQAAVRRFHGVGNGTLVFFLFKRACRMESGFCIKKPILFRRQIVASFCTIILRPHMLHKYKLRLLSLRAL